MSLSNIANFMDNAYLFSIKNPLSQIDKVDFMKIVKEHLFFQNQIFPRFKCKDIIAFQVDFLA